MKHATWTPEWEVTLYWDLVIGSESETAFYLTQLRADLKHFDIHDVDGLVVDVGSGALGGVFGIREFRGEKMIVDPLATEFGRRYGKIPEGVKVMDGYCQDIPLNNDSATAVFCIEALDHCNSVDEYRQSADELARVLQPGGRLYFMIPLRGASRDGHYLTLETMSVEDMEAAFPLTVVKREVSNGHLWLTMEKPGIPLQQRIDALSDDRQWAGGWYQPIDFPDGSRTHSTKLSDAQFYGSECRGIRKWRKAIAQHLPNLRGKSFLEIGCNAGLYLSQAWREGAVAIIGVENHPYFARQCRFVLEHLCPCAPVTLIEQDATELDWSLVGEVDVVLLANALYWVGYTDEHGAYPDRDRLMQTFLSGLAHAAQTVIVVGAEEGKQYADLASTTALLAPWFDLRTAEIVRVNDRVLNVIVGESRCRK